MRNRTPSLFMAAALALAPAAVGAQAAPERWWQELGDSTLARLTADALVANQDVRAAVARVAQARAARLDAALDMAPTVTVAAGYSRQRTSAAAFGFDIPDRDLWDAEVRASWEVDVFGRLRRSLRGQSALADAATEDVGDIRRAIAAEVALAYFALREGQERLAVAHRNADNQGRTLQLTRDLLEGGRGTEFDTERADAQLATTLASVPALEAAVAAAEHRLAVLLGQPAGSLGAELRGGSVPTLPDALPALDIAAVIAERPDVRAAERRLVAGGAFVGAAKADYLPRLSIGGTAGYTAGSFDDLGSSGTGRYLVGPMLTWPAFNLGRVKSTVDRARAREAEARAEHEHAVLRAGEEIATAYATYQGARAQLTLLDRAAAASERAADLARLRFEEGVTDFLTVLDAERTLLAAQDRLARGRTEAQAALVAVFRATGGGTTP